MGSNLSRTARHIEGTEGSWSKDVITEDRRTEMFSAKNLRKESQRSYVGMIGAESQGFIRVLKMLKRT